MILEMFLKKNRRPKFNVNTKKNAVDGSRIQRHKMHFTSKMIRLNVLKMMTKKRKKRKQMK